MNRNLERIISTLCALILLLGAALFGVACDRPAGEAHGPDGHEEHRGEEETHQDHDAHHEAATHDDHDDEDKAHGEHGAEEEAGGHAGHDDHGEEGIVRLDERQLESLEMTETKVTRGTLSQTLSLSGEVRWNPDLVVHLTPRVEGLVREVNRTLGDTVTAGEVMAVLDSPQIGRARMDYLEARARRELTEANRERVEAVARNTRRLMEILDAGPSPDVALERSAGLPIGDYKTRLMSAYTRLQVATRNWERERQLRQKQISSEADYLEALGRFETARSDYQSLREAIDYELEQDLIRVRNEEKVATTALLNADRTLHILGLSQDQIEALHQSADRMDESISRVSLRAPMDGLVVDRHLSIGEQVAPDSTLYKLADISEVWFMARVYESDLRRLAPGLRAVVRLDAWPGESFEGVLDYIGSELDPETRTLPARVVLPNPRGRLKSGLFGRVAIMTSGNGGGLLVPSGAVQRTAEGHTVFRLREPGVFQTVPVRIVEQGDAFVQVEGDLKPGDRLVTGDTLTLMTEARREALGGGHSH